MKCYYEELCVERDASEADIKTAYRKMALKWHPDKNLNSLDEAKERFQLIQQAYEVLSDPQERAWYDNHREQILRGKNSDYEDSCLDVFQYFTVSCFKGYADDAKGFYAVYREVFEKIAAEDAEFMDDEEEMENIPKFGDSTSSYEEVVGPFYAYWSAYCTKKTYTWLCPYDIKDIKDRRILRQIEKDMKKVVQNAKKERNEEVRNLVSFMRKRDKRVQAYKKVLEERAAFNRQKQEQNRLEQIRRRQQELKEIKENSKTNHNDDYEEQLKQLEQEYSSNEDYYDEEDDDDDDDDDDDEDEVEDADVDEEADSDNVEQQNDQEDVYIDDLYCVACNKTFKTQNAIANHETSKKHHDNIEKLKLEMQEEENSYQQEKQVIADIEDDDIEIIETEECIDNDILTDQQIDESIDKDEELIRGSKTKSRKNKNKKESKKPKLPAVINSDDEELGILSQQTNKIEISELDYNKDSDDDWNNSNKKSSKKTKSKNKTAKKPTNLNESAAAKIEVKEVQSDAIKLQTKPSIQTKTNIQNKTILLGVESDVTEHICVTCKSKFDSKNKLFSHLKITNHGVYIPKAKANDEDSAGRSKKGKGKKK